MLAVVVAMLEVGLMEQQQHCCLGGGEFLDILLDLQDKSNVLKNAQRLHSYRRGCDGTSRGT